MAVSSCSSIVKRRFDDDGSKGFSASNAPRRSPSARTTLSPTASARSVGTTPRPVRTNSGSPNDSRRRRKAALTGLPEQDATIIRFGRQLYGDRKVDSATFAKVVEQLGQRGAMDLVAVMNTYAVSGFYGIAVDERAAVGKPSLER